MSCDRCELSKKCTNVKITSRSEKSKIMLILDAPSKSDDRFGRILSSDVKLKLAYFLDRCKLNEEDIYITYAVKCNPGGKISGIKSKHVKACNYFLKKEIQKCKPKVIIASGRYAYESLTGTTSVGDFRGHFEDFSMDYKVSIGDEMVDKKFTCKVMPTMSIDSSMTAWTMDDYIINDLKKAKKYWKKDIIDVTPIPKFKLYTDIRELQAAAKFLSEQKYTYFDTETTGLYFYRNHIINAGFTHAANELVHIWYMSVVPKDHMKKYTEVEKQRMAKINKFTAKYKKEIHEATQLVMGSRSRKIAHNIKFDLKMMYAHGIKTSNVYFDTMVADALVDENKYHDLNSCMEIRGINFGPYDTNLWQYVNKDRKNKKPYSWVPSEILTTYLAIDVGGLAMLHPKIIEDLKSEKTAPNEAMYKLMFKQQMPLLKELYRMEIRGFHADESLLRSMGKEIGEKIVELEKQFSKLTGGTVKISSNDQLGKYFTEHNYPFDKVHAKRGVKGYSVGEDTLKKFINLKKFRKIPELVLEYRGLGKLKSTYLDGKDGESGLVKMVSSKGKFHCSYNLHIARTGRLSSSEPNLQNIPNKANGVQVRNVFVPPPGQVTWECDFSQLELRVIAWMARDKILIDEIQKGKDLHSYNAVNFGKDLKFIDEATTIEEFLKTYKYEPPEGWRDLPEKERLEVEDLIEQQFMADKLRKLAKKIAFGLNYGIEPGTVAEEFGISVEQAETAFSSYFKKYTKVDKFIHGQVDVVLQKGYLELPITGRRRRFTQAVRWLNSEHGQDYYMRRYLLAEIERQAMNFPVQGLANEIYVQAKLRLANDLRKNAPKAKLGLTIHDGMVNTGFKEDMKNVEELVKINFKDQLGEGRWAVPLTSDFKVLTRWGGDKVSDY